MSKEKKFDYQHMDVKLYLALRDLLSDKFSTAEEQDELEHRAKLAMEEFQLSRGQLPDWAIDWNWGYELVPGAQLLTKDGRRHGNAHILRVEGKAPDERIDPYDERRFYCITDAGSCINALSAAELENSFWIGEWISDSKTLIARFGNHGDDYGTSHEPA